MPDETENQTLRLIREIRDETRQFREEVRQSFAEVNRRLAEMDQCLAEMILRIDGVTHIMTPLAGHINRHEEGIAKREEDSS